MSDLAAALAGITVGHMSHVDLSTGGYGQPDAICACGQWRLAAPYTIDSKGAAHAEHVAALQVVYLRENLAEHAEELGMRREWAVQFEKPTPDLIDRHEITVEQQVPDEVVASAAVRNHVPTSGKGHRAVTRYVTDWSRNDHS